MIYTTNQQEALDYRGGNLLIIACAGQFLKTFATCMGRIHTYYVQTCVEQLFYKINIATLVRNRCNGLCLF